MSSQQQQQQQQQQQVQRKEPTSQLYKKFPRRQINDEMRPRAAVIGAGIAGCHCAWELSRIGFDVTVYEQFRHAGEGATKYDSGYVPRALSTSSSQEEGNSSNSISSSSTTSETCQNISSLLFPTNVWSFNAKKELILSLLVPLQILRCGPIICGDTPWSGFTRESWRTWAKCRRKIRPTEMQLTQVANDITGRTNSIVDSIIEAEPKLFGSCVFAQEKNNDDKNNNNNENSSSCAWKCIDTSRWCRTFSEVLQNDYNVKFKYRSMITRLTWRVNDVNEFVSSVVATDIDSRETKSEATDLVVVAAGSMSILERNPQANEGYPLPLLSVAGYGLDVPVSMCKEWLLMKTKKEEQEEVSSALVSLGNNSSSNGSAEEAVAVVKKAVQKLKPYYMSEGDFLRVSVTPPSAARPVESEAMSEAELLASLSEEERAKVENSLDPKEKLLQKRQQELEAATQEPRIRLQGLLSLLGDDVRGLRTEPSHSYALLYPRLKYNCRDVVSNSSSNLASASVTSPVPSELHKLSYSDMDNPEKNGGVSAFHYARGFTSDGLPLVSRCGAARNVFLCCGFGDSAAMFAPGSAEWLGEILMKKRSNTCKDGDRNEEMQDIQERESRWQPNKGIKLKSNPLALDRFYEFAKWMQYDEESPKWQQRWYRMEKGAESIGQPILDRLYGDFQKSTIGSYVFRLGHKKEDDY